MKKILQSLYIKTDTNCKELSKAGLLQLVLKIIYSLNDPSETELKSEVGAILGVKVGQNL